VLRLAILHKLWSAKLCITFIRADFGVCASALAHIAREVTTFNLFALIAVFIPARLFCLVDYHPSSPIEANLTKSAIMFREFLCRHILATIHPARGNETVVCVLLAGILDYASASELIAMGVNARAGILTGNLTDDLATIFVAVWTRSAFPRLALVSIVTDIVVVLDWSASPCRVARDTLTFLQARCTDHVLRTTVRGLGLRAITTPDFALVSVVAVLLRELATV
jgi:hypothetical protein